MEFHNLKGKRVSKKMTQNDLAQFLGIGYSTYNLKENGKLDFSYSEIEKLMILFESSYEELFFRENAHESGAKTNQQVDNA